MGVSTDRRCADFRGERVVRAAVGVLVAVTGWVVVVGLPEVAVAAPSAVAQTRLEAPDEASAMRLAYRKRLPVLVTGQTSETTQVWAQPDGQFRMTLHSAPERMR